MQRVGESGKTAAGQHGRIERVILESCVGREEEQQIKVNTEAMQV